MSTPCIIQRIVGHIAVANHIRMRATTGLLVQVRGTDTPTDGRGNTQTKRSLVVDVDALWKVRQRDDIDVVGGVGSRRLNRRGFNKTWEALAIAVDGGIDPIADRDSRAGIRIRFVDHGRCVYADGQKRAEQR